MAKLSKAQRAEKRLKRQQAAEQVVESRVRTGLGFALAYAGSQLLPRFISGSFDQTIIDLILMGVGGYFAFTDDGEFGDFMFGVGLVGTIQTIDTAVGKLETWLDTREQQAAA